MKVQRTERFERDYKKLDPVRQRRVDKAIGQLESNPRHSALGAIRVHDEIWKCRISRADRLIYRQEGDAIGLLRITDHDHQIDKAALYSLVTLQGGFMFGSEERLEGSLDEMREHRRHETDQQIFPLEDPVAEVIREALRNGVNGKARPPRDLGGMGSSINIIPSEALGNCTPTLLVLIFDKDSFKDRLRQAAYHAGIHCPDTNEVIIVTTRWDPVEWKKNHEEAFSDLRAHLLGYIVTTDGSLARLV